MSDKTGPGRRHPSGSIDEFAVARGDCASGRRSEGEGRGCLKGNHQLNLTMATLRKSAEWITPEEYLEGERHSEIRHEYVEGHVYAMAGASDDHNRIAGSIFAELRERLRGRKCEAFAIDMKVKIPPRFMDVFYY